MMQAVLCKGDAMKLANYAKNINEEVEIYVQHILVSERCTIEYVGFDENNGVNGNEGDGVEGLGTDGVEGLGTVSVEEDKTNVGVGVEEDRTDVVFWIESNGVEDDIIEDLVSEMHDEDDDKLIDEDEDMKGSDEYEVEDGNKDEDENVEEVGPGRNLDYVMKSWAYLINKISKGESES
ncbi:hypothetical protein VNO80_06630 [Phaseolus coccineus]|uniref:Uncharacterized protein n=1 Tax=Phaseolus coccineus TaxID=3886 RepID=A0AAN9NHU8_PHACN